MKILHGGAFSTGGGCIAILGELDNGMWFISDNMGWSVVDFDTRKTCKEMGISDGYDDDDLAVFWIDYDSGHYIDIDEKELDNAFHDFCIRYDCKEPGITDGYEKFDCIWGNLCDYIDWSRTKIDEYSKPIHFKDIMNNRLDKAINEIMYDIQDRLDIENGVYDSKKFKKAKELLVNEMIKLLESDNEEEV